MHKPAAAVMAGATTYSGSVTLPNTGVWYIRAHHADDTHSETYTGWKAVNVSAAIVLPAPKPRSTMYKNHTYTVSGTLQPKHTSGTYLKVYAYRWSTSLHTVGTSRMR